MKTFAFIFLIFLICSASHGQGNDIHCMFTEMCTPAGATTSNELKGTLRYIAKSQSMSFHYTSPKDSTITLYGNKGQAFALRQLLISTITQDYSSVSKRNKVETSLDDSNKTKIITITATDRFLLRYIRSVVMVYDEPSGRMKTMHLVKADGEVSDYTFHSIE
ncbi:MAG: hypothetical protein HUJ96_01950 [Marinilabiliaceae bacterium]|nr:hypothetical protein [Marinilabiliaceae bacterium]